MGYIWYRNGRDVVKSYDIDRESIYSVTKEYFDDYIGTESLYWRSLNLSGVGVSDLGELQHVSSDLILEKSKIKSLGKLESVSGKLDLRNTEIRSLGGLKRVQSHLDLRGTHITDLGKLEYVGIHIYCIKGSVTHTLLLDSKFKNQIDYFPVTEIGFGWGGAGF